MLFWNRLRILGLLLFVHQAALAQLQLPDRMYGDSAHAPFYHGVASGDPLPDRVIIWTKYTPHPTQSSTELLTYELATDNAFANIVQTGTVIAEPAHDWCAKVDVSGLQPYTKYWYRFRTNAGGISVTGRTQTAPAAGSSNTQFRAAIASCSSIYSGYFNGYARIGERHDIDLVIHLGDYIYDFVDADEQVRIPTPAPADPITLQDWRDRHAYYLLDPDLRLARGRHPWTAIWDNHDLDGGSSLLPQQAFYEYLPIREPDSNDISRIYRKLSYGNLLDIFLIDVTTKRDIDTLPGGAASLLGDAQWQWLSSALTASTSQWKIIGNERMVANFSLAGLPSFIPFGDGPVADSSAWDGYTGERDRLLNFLTTNGIDNTVMLSGDIHMSFATDLAPSGTSYDPQTGSGSAAVEFLPTSISRGNFDEAGFGGFLATVAQAAMAAANPHHRFQELTSHGYGIIDIRPARTVAEFWYSDILSYTQQEQFEAGLTCLDGANHWERQNNAGPTVGMIDAGADLPYTLRTYPNPSSQGQVQLVTNLPLVDGGTVKVYNASTASLVLELTVQPNFSEAIGLDLGDLPSGIYLIRLETDHGQVATKALLTR